MDATLGPAQTIKDLEDQNLTRICQVVAVTWTLYDHCITFGEEVELIWWKRWTVATVLFILANQIFGGYVVAGHSNGFIYSRTVAHCNLYLEFQAWGCGFFFCSMQGTLLIRLFAMLKTVGKYRRSLAIFLVTLFGLQALCFGIVIIYCYHSLGAALAKLPKIRTCTAMNTARFLPAWWVPMGIMDLTLFVLALHVAIHHMKDVRIFREMRHRRRRGEGASVAINRGEGENLDNPMRSIMEVIIEDSIPYYAGLLAVQIINSTVWLGLRHHSPNVSHIPQYYGVVFVSIFGCRMVLNMRRESEESLARGGGSQFRLSGVEGMLQPIENSFEIGERDLLERSNGPSESGASSASAV